VCRALLLLALAGVRAGAAEIRVECGERAPHRVSAVALSPAERALLDASDPASFTEVLAVFTGAVAASRGAPAVAGAYALDVEGLHFRPRFPFVSGLRYTARLALGRAAPLVRGFEVAPPSGEGPRVTAVFPSSDELPENVLRVYVHFSRAMEIRDSHRHVRLEDADGRVVSLAFVEVQHGLWDAGRTRLTLLFHPGRIKRGVAPGERLGPPLPAGGTYRLVVDAAMSDAAGRPLGRDFEWPIRAGTADRDPPRAEGLRVRAPAAANAPLVVELPEPLDEALLHRLIWVEDAQGRALTGTAAISDGETRWSFRPEQAWSPGRYALRVHPALEDRAGNRFDRAFERETAAQTIGEADPPPLRLEFTIEKGGP
jgi:hypothetical protein